MIDLSAEKVISFTEATKLLPRRRAGKRPHVATLYRWANRGLRGICLETIQVGGTRCTSIEALQRFFDSLNGSVPCSGLQSTQSRLHQIEESQRKLKSLNL